MKEIRNIIQFYDTANQAKERFALASVVNIEESSYRRIGARMLVSSSGRWIGGISGGCLEGDALKRSQVAIFNNTASTVVYDTMDDDSNQIGVGLGCNGKIEVLFTPIDSDAIDSPINQLKSIINTTDPVIILKVIKSDDHALLGSMDVVRFPQNKIDFCGISSDYLIEAISQTRVNRRPQIIRCPLEQNKSLEVLVEYVRPETRLVVVGDNYDVLALLKVAKELGWIIDLVGRKKKMSKQVFQLADRVYEFDELNQIAINEFTALVLMTHDYNLDLKMLPTIKNLKPPYVGVLGPKKRINKLKKDVVHTMSDWMDDLHSPIGLDIGGETPEEIAIAIVSEIIASFRSRKGSFLKHREGTIHLRS